MTDVPTLVMNDLKKRRDDDGARYGAPPLPGDGTDALRVAYNATLDVVLALRQLLAERDGLDTTDHRGAGGEHP